MNIDKLKFNNKTGLIPMIVQDANTGLVLSLFYANNEAVQKMQETGEVWRFSRSKKKLMRKGEESGNIQKVVSISEDCDSDTLLVLVSPEGPACHKGSNSCFKGQAILEELVSVIKERRTKPIDSYTSKLVKDKAAIVAKLKEECEELIEARNESEIKWEAADLLYFMLVYLENRNVAFEEVLKELRGRRK